MDKTVQNVEDFEELKSASEAHNPKPQILQVKQGEHVLKGNFLKKNKFMMKQERDFRLYPDGTIDYYKGDTKKGTIELQKNLRCKLDEKKNIISIKNTKGRTYTLI